MATLDTEIAAFKTIRQTLEVEHMGEWILVHGHNLIAATVSFDEAARIAVKSFGRGPYLIRQVGTGPIVLPASLRYFQARC